VRLFVNLFSFGMVVDRRVWKWGRNRDFACIKHGSMGSYWMESEGVFVVYSALGFVKRVRIVVVVVFHDRFEMLRDALFSCTVRS
jgi:hypothetical protein